jgi:hypothetical protein
VYTLHGEAAGVGVEGVGFHILEPHVDVADVDLHSVEDVVEDTLLEARLEESC